MTVLLSVRIILLIFSSFFLFFIIGTTSNDIENYRIVIEGNNQIEGILGKSFLDAFKQNRGELGSWFLIWLSSRFFYTELAFFSVALFSLLIKEYMFNRFFNYSLMAFVSYVFIFVHILDANQLRESLAICFVFYALFTEPKNKLTYLVLTILALNFHYAGIMILTLYFVKYPLLLTIFIFLIFNIFNTLVNQFPIFSFASIWISGFEGQANYTNSLFIVQIFISLSSYTIWNKLTEIQKKAIFFNSLGIFIYILFNDYPIIAHRVRELTQLSILPLLLYHPLRFSLQSFIWIVALIYYFLYNARMIMAELNSIYSIL